jgi:hypothetical protein
MEPAQYLPFINRQRLDNDCRPISADSKVECCSCPAVFPFRQGVVFQAQCDGEVIVGLFCSAVCYLAAIPKEACSHA